MKMLDSASKQYIFIYQLLTTFLNLLFPVIDATEIFNQIFFTTATNQNQTKENDNKHDILTFNHSPRWTARYYETLFALIYYFKRQVWDTFTLEINKR